ncbi:glycoside hydrolase family 88 protein [Seonamhaeicola maritimus]|uniref:Glycosyl hydrolase n=1 Tax=Seonamhaeicola maritimus TaxID=2591822 RepID=A0A5C7GGP4_9FLAO|nr:glycoside hydrolase family 88 protein [Seonamhaeicola maritimus]TXG35900.1 glycosyl hydrolase [Seonamhaeicola maritimus]
MRHYLLFLIAITLFYNCQEQEEKILIPSPNEVLKITEKVANWQIETFEEMGKYRALPSPDKRKKWHNRDKHHELEWTNAALYSGMFELTKVSHYPKYINWLATIGQKNKWQLYNRMYHADDHAVGQLYLSLNQNIRFRRSASIEPTKVRFDSIMKSEKGKEYQWDWCDALFMAPPVWARLAKVTKDSTYLEYMDKQYRMTYEELWDTEEQLFFRDKSYLDKKEKNGEEIFWSRGNGWVFGGLALMLPDLPKNWESKPFYENLFKQLAQTLVKTQRPDGTWSGGVLGDLKDYPIVETSGSSFFAYGIAWGINNGLLDKATYEPVLFKAWNALTKCVNDDGMLGYVQPIGAAPGESFKDYTEVYGIGAFLAAGSELHTYLNKFHPLARDNQYQTFMKDGGWCWYQDPRAIISNGKLLISGLSGQSGDVRLGVYDLKSEKNDSTLTMHKNFQRDDHNVPALYQRPGKSVLAVWAKHGNEKVHHFNISTSNDYLKWGEPKKIEHTYNHKNGVTYMNLYYVKNEGKLYNFFRSGLTFNPSFVTSEDHGETWGNSTHFIANDIKGYQRPYARYYQKDENTVAVSYTDGHPRQYGNNLFYAEFTNGAFFKADGTKIKNLSDGVLRASEGEKVYTGSDTFTKTIVQESVPNSAWTCAMATDKGNNPHLGYTLYLSDSDHRYRIASWNGEKWIDREIAYAGKCLYKVESSYTGLLAFDPEDPTKVYISSDVDPSTGEDLGGVHEIYEATVGAKDDITSIKWKAITSNSNYRNIRPIVVSNEGYKVLLWLNGPWYDYMNYNSNVQGIILEKPDESS